MKDIYYKDSLEELNSGLDINDEIERKVYLNTLKCIMQFERYFNKYTDYYINPGSTFSMHFKRKVGKSALNIEIGMESATWYIADEWITKEGKVHFNKKYTHLEMDELQFHIQYGNF